MEPPVRPDAKLWDEDPIEAMRQTELYRQKMEDFQAESAKHQHLQQQAMAEKQKQMQEALNQQQVALKERIPEWQNEETATKEKAEIRRFGLSMGFTENELAQIYDSRAVQVLRDAMRYNQLQTKRGKVKQAPQGKSLAPGTPTPGEPQQLRKAEAMKRLAETGHIKDAQAVFEQILGHVKEADMAAIANTFITSDAVGNREDLQNAIYSIAPFDTPFMSAIGRENVEAVTHEWQTDNLAAAASNAHNEGFDVSSFTAVSPTTRESNICQISMKDVIVSETQNVVNKAGRTSEVAYQVAKNSKELKRDINSSSPRTRLLFSQVPGR